MDLWIILDFGMGVGKRRMNGCESDCFGGQLGVQVRRGSFLPHNMTRFVHNAAPQLPLQCLSSFIQPTQLPA
jgi:hypothetical protein